MFKQINTILFRSVFEIFNEDSICFIREKQHQLVHRLPEIAPWELHRSRF